MRQPPTPAPTSISNARSPLADRQQLAVHLGWSIGGGRLRLTKGDAALVFTDEGAATPATPLLGTAWTVSGYDTSRKLPYRYHAVGGATAVVTIDRTGYRMEDSCSVYAGTADVRGDRIVPGPASVVRGHPCGNPAVEDEVAVLPGTYQWLIIGHRLYLSASDQTDIDFRSCSPSGSVCR